MGGYSYSLGKRCKHCGKAIGDQTTTGMCHNCRMTIGQRGELNHCFGKKYTEAEKKHFSEKSKEKWKDDEYRRKVIEGATGLKRSETFRKGQSVRTAESYNRIKGLREKRGKLFSQCWKDGRNHYHAVAAHRSSEEIEVRKYLELTNRYTITTEEIKVEGGYLAPDIVVNDKVVVEFYGDYFHANPNKYKPNDFIKAKGLIAKQIWELDSIRKDKIISAGYQVIIVWQKDYRENKEQELIKLVSSIDEMIKN